METGKYPDIAYDCIFTDLCDKKAVNDIVERIYHHGEHHRKRHGQKQREDRLLFHKLVVHIYLRFCLWQPMRLLMCVWISHCLLPGAASQKDLVKCDRQGTL